MKTINNRTCNLHKLFMKKRQNKIVNKTKMYKIQLLLMLTNSLTRYPIKLQIFKISKISSRKSIMRTTKIHMIIKATSLLSMKLIWNI